MSVVKIFVFLALAPRLNFKRFNGAGKIEHFSKVSGLVTCCPAFSRRSLGCFGEVGSLPQALVASYELK
jgi:hypothetical protein